MRPLCIDLYAGLGGWADGFLAEGYDVIGFDIERHVYGDQKYPAQLVLQDVLTLHGSQFRDAAVIVASPPCQAYSYRAMPWKRAKALPPPDNTLFEACFRIAREAGVPLVVENVKAAQPWAGKAAWHYGSFYLWGDVPALMPITNFHGSAARAGVKNNGGSWFNIAHNTKSGVGQNPVNGVKVPSENGRRTDIGNGARFTTRGCGIEGNKGFARRFENTPMARVSSKSSARKSAQIAKIPYPLSLWIAQCFKPGYGSCIMSRIIQAVAPAVPAAANQPNKGEL